MTETINEIIKKHKNLFSESPFIVEKINAGFTNTLFRVNNEFIVKICHKADNEEEFLQEIKFYLANENKGYIPNLYAHSTDKKVVPYFYEIIERIDGVSLYHVWHTFNETKREQIVKQICEIMADFHQIKGTPYDWSSYIKDFYEEHLNVLIKKNLLKENDILLVRNAMNRFDEYLKSDEFVFIHNDLHFDNIFINKNNELKIIDFESSRFAPVDKEFEVLMFMAEQPYKHANENDEQFVKQEDYANLIAYFKKYYPKPFKTPYFEKRIAIYNLRDTMDLYCRFSHEQALHNRILEKAKYIIG
ncbi:MAG: aminoglycoside phosphotransferase family protein [Clostridiales bacterium]|jgi:aminoglycoside phosphotransferase (APT) family kinase protein|nr:aminoglycoside phosphotransferase family protein [Clostridiales bacterium]